MFCWEPPRKSNRKVFPLTFLPRKKHKKIFVYSLSSAFLGIFAKERQGTLNSQSCPWPSFLNKNIQKCRGTTLISLISLCFRWETLMYNCMEEIPCYLSMFLLRNTELFLSYSFAKVRFRELYMNMYLSVSQLMYNKQDRVHIMYISSSLIIEQVCFDKTSLLSLMLTQFVYFSCTLY